MADYELKVRLLPCAHTAAEWASSTYKDKILKAGEIGYEKNTGRYKIGDGTNKWANLPWAKATPYGDFIPLNTSGGIGSIRGNGKYWYCLIATIKISSNYINDPITFEISGRGFLTSIVQVMFQNKDNTDPGLNSFTTNGYDKFYIVKSDTSTWKIYGMYTESWGTLVLHRITGSGSNIGVTVNLENADALPAGATQASYYGNVSYATNAGSATQANKLTVNAGSSTNPVYFNGGVPTACSGRTVPGIKSASEVTTLGWGTNNNYVADISLLSYWNGAYSGTSSNLAYCKQGAFGTIVTKAAGDYLAVGGTAVAAKKLANYYSSRQASANLTADGSGGIVNFKATSTMTAGKPMADGHILHFYWDNTGGWDAQFYIPTGNTNGYTPQWRGMNGGAWQDWRTFLDSGNYTSYTVKKDGTGATGTWGISISGNAATASKLAAARTLALNGLSNATLTFDGSANISADNWGYGTRKYVTQNSTSAPYFRIAYASSKGDWFDASMVFIIDSGYKSGGFGIVKVAMRNEDVSKTGTSHCEVKWLVREGFAANQIFIKGYSSPGSGTAQYADLYFKAVGTYNAIIVTALSIGQRGSVSRIWTFDSGDPRTAANIRTYNTEYIGVDAGISNQANTLTTARTINGTSFNGSANITTANWGTARTLTVGNTGKSVNGAGNVSWSLSEIGALPTAGGTMSGDISFATIASWPTVSGETYPIESKGLYWSGSSDLVKLFYRVVSSDGGKFIIQLGDSTDEEVIVENTAGTVYAKIGNGGVTANNFYGNATSATYLKDKTDGTASYLNYGSSGMSSASWYGAWDGYTLRAISPANLATHLATTTLDARYVNISGDTMTGPLTISHATTATMTSATTNPRIIFSEFGTQPVALVYTNYDSYRSPAGLKVLGMSSDASKAWFEVEGNLYASTVTASTFIGSLTGTATNAKFLANNTSYDYSNTGLSWFNADLSVGASVQANDAPVAGWWHMLRFNHSDSDAYYTDLAVPFNNNSLYYKCIRDGAVANNGWVKVLDGLNYSSSITSLTKGLTVSNGSLTPLTIKGGVSGNLESSISYTHPEVSSSNNWVVGMGTGGTGYGYFGFWNNAYGNVMRLSNNGSAYVSNAIYFGGQVSSNDGKVRLFSDSEGGNISLVSPNNIEYQIDTINGEFRMYRRPTDGSSYVNFLSVRDSSGHIYNADSKVICARNFTLSGNTLYITST